MTIYTNILIPTDGLELCGKAVQHGIALVKSIDAKIIVMTVLPPFHMLTTNTQMIEGIEIHRRQGALNQLGNFRADQVGADKRRGPCPRRDGRALKSSWAARIAVT